MNEKISCHKVESFVPVKKSVTRNSLEKNKEKEKRNRRKERKRERRKAKEKESVFCCQSHATRMHVNVDGMKERVVPVKSQGS